MKLKGLILAFLVVASSSANATVTTSAVVGAVASANASRHIRQDANHAIHSVNKALENSTKVLVPCYPKYKGGFFDGSIIDRELTISTCEEENESLNA